MIYGKIPVDTSHILTFSLVVSFLLVTVVVSFSYATITPADTSKELPIGDTKPKPGIIVIITYENGTTKAIRSDSTNAQPVNAGYFISDPTVQASKPLQSKAVSKTVVQQLVSMFVEIRVDEPATISSEGCGEGYGYYVDNPDPICEPLDKIGQDLPPDQAFCAALGCPYNPPADSELPDDNEGDSNNNGFATTPITPTSEPTYHAIQAGVV